MNIRTPIEVIFSVNEKVDYIRDAHGIPLDPQDVIEEFNAQAKIVEAARLARQRLMQIAKVLSAIDVLQYLDLEEIAEQLGDAISELDSQQPTKDQP